MLVDSLKTIGILGGAVAVGTLLSALFQMDVLAHPEFQDRLDEFARADVSPQSDEPDE